MRDPKLKANSDSVMLGDWDTDTVRLDFDNTILDEVKYWAFRACFWFKQDGFIILESSRKEYVVKRKGEVLHEWVRASYLVIFNRPAKWDLNVRIMNWVALQSKNAGLEQYVRMQCIKRSSTVRLGPKIDKPPPRVVYRYGKQDRQIRKLLETQEFILDALDMEEVD